MSALTLKLHTPPPMRLNLAPLHASNLAGKTSAEIESIALTHGARPVRVADIFSLSGSPGDSLHIEGGSNRLDYIATHADGGTIIVEGDVGAYAAHKMKSGRLDIRGNAQAYLASSLNGGLITVTGSAGDHLGGPHAGERDGISGGTVIVTGAIGELGGERMRRGTIITHAKTGANTGARMMGGTIIAPQGFGPCAGIQMRRGMLIAPSMDNMLTTFVDCGHHDLGIVHIISRHLQKTLGELAPELPASRVHRFAGDMASLGKGEILLTQ